MSDSAGEKLVCNICLKVLFYREDQFFDEQGEKSEGSWCHGMNHQSPYFLCAKHTSFMHTDEYSLAVSFCPMCVLSN